MVYENIHWMEVAAPAKEHEFLSRGEPLRVIIQAGHQTAEGCLRQLEPRSPSSWPNAVAASPVPSADPLFPHDEALQDPPNCL